MVNAVAPVTDPLSFIIINFVMGIGFDAIGTIVKLAILSSVLVFPFALFGRKIYEWIGIENRFFNLLFTTFVTVFVFLMAVRLWAAAWGSPFLMVGAGSLAIGYLAASLITFVIAVIGDFISHKLRQKWDIPWALALYTVDLVMCFLLFIGIYLGLYIASLAIG